MASTDTISTQPAYCYASRNFVPSINGAPKYYAEVPLYQTHKPTDDMTAILQECCHSKVWLYLDPNPCTAVCNSNSVKQAHDVSYCLNSKTIIYGGNVLDSGSSLISSSTSVWTVLLVGGLMISGMMV
ncbi:hypothetical protein N7490_011826 [Penicillium lividum]|nr:hypothetical protein N7490_011826 [Penicillium lividum]